MGRLQGGHELISLDLNEATLRSADEIAAQANIDADRRRWLASGRGLCPQCGSAFLGEGVCPHHSASYCEGWAESNRVWCDFVHRGRVGKSRVSFVSWWEEAL